MMTADYPITKSDILFSVLPNGNMNMKNTGWNLNLNPFIRLQVLHAQGDNELTMVTQAALPQKQHITPTHRLSQFKFQEEPY